MKRAAAVVLVLGLLAAGCGEGEVEEIETSTTAPPPSTTTSTVAASTTQPASTTTQPAPTTTTSGSTTEPPVWAGPGFPEARPPEEIPWDQVGPGWLLARYVEASDSWETSTREALFLIDPEDVVYAVTGWDGAQILDWSPDGRRVLTFDGELKVVGLAEGATSAVLAVIPIEWHVDGRFAPGGDGLVLRLATEGHVRLELVGADGALRTTFADFDYPAGGYGDPAFVEMGITWLYDPDGTRLVVATSEGIVLRDGQGVVVRMLDTPGLGCTLSRWWEEGSVLAACYDPDWAASTCWYRGPVPDGRSLWAVPLDGSAATLLTPQPVCVSEATEPAPAYADGLPIGDLVAARTGSCCECGGRLDLIAGSTVTFWEGYEDSYPCSPSLVAARPEGVLVLDTLYGWDADEGATGMLGVIFEVAADGTTRAVTPAEPGLYGGVRQVFTTEEVGG
ncbi:MAG: hypothetical protein H6Q11_351 [Acidobacteria bacterium]|nr:hypothetical protein [Acidobacteriota bacterium]